MNFLDVRTVLFSQLITDAVCTTVLISLWLQNRKRYAGMIFWVVDFIFQTTAILLIIIRGSIPDWLSAVLSNTLVIAGALMGYLGLERFIGKRNSQVHNYVLLGVFILVHFYFLSVHPSLQARTLNLSLGLLVICFQCTWLLLRRAGSGLTRMTVEVGWVFAIFCLVSLIRILVIFTIPEPVNDFFKTGLYDTLILMSYQILLILLTFGLALMVNRRLLMQVKSQEEKFTKAFHSSPYAILITRLSDGMILDVNRGFEEIFGYLSSEAIGKTTLSLHLWVKETDRQQVIAELSARGEVQGMEFQFRTKSDKELTGLYYAEILFVDDEQLIMASISDITARKQTQDALLKSEALLREQSVRDHLTGLFNRRYMEETLERELRRASRKQSSLGIIMLDVDDFKRFNDTHGHAAGDAILQELGNLLIGSIRGEDIACRYGGDEFIMVLPDASMEITLERAERLSEFARHLNIQFEGQTLGVVTLSLGIAVFPENGSTSETVLKAADGALYRAKREGHGRVAVAK